MSSHITRKLFTIDDYWQMERAGIFKEVDRVELIHGEFLTVSPNGPPHGAAVARANRAFMSIFGDRVIVWPQSSVVLDAYNVPQPDIVILEPREDFYSAKLPEPPDILLIVEMADSSLAYDRKVKTQLYAESGIQEYWLVDIPHDCVIVHSDVHEKRYRAVRKVFRGASIRPKLLPEYEIPVGFLLP